MDAVFDKNCTLVGWYEPETESFFDTQMNWTAFVSDDHAFSADTGNWLGALESATFQDQSGKAALWMPDLGSPESSMRPLRPLRPLKPLRPLRPLRPLNPLRPLRPLMPLGGWSSLSFDTWKSQK